MSGNYAEIDYSEAIEGVLMKFKLPCSFVFAVQGPAFTRYILSPYPGTKVSTILKKADAIAAAMPVRRVRIAVPVREFVAIGVEIPNRFREVIGFKAMRGSLAESGFRLPVALGRTVEGNDFLIDLAEAPHVLIAGNKGSGKTMLLHSFVCSLACVGNLEEIRFILTGDDCSGLERYNGCPWLDRPVSSGADGVFLVLEDIASEIERRIRLLSGSGARRIADYNRNHEEKLPYLVVMVDEFAGAARSDGKRFDSLIKRITAVARFCGVHLVLTTAHPCCDVVTPVVRSNFPASVALVLPDGLCSRIVINHEGAENLLGNGDLLYFKWDMHRPVRMQAPFVNPERCGIFLT